MLLDSGIEILLGGDKLLEIEMILLTMVLLWVMLMNQVWIKMVYP